MHAHLKSRRTQSDGRCVLADHAGVTLSLFDADRLTRAAAERFHAERSAPPKELEHARVFHTISKAIEDCLFDKIWRRADAEALRDFEVPSSRCSAGDSHG